jgi:MFS family permease
MNTIFRNFPTKNAKLYLAYNLFNNFAGAFLMGTYVPFLREQGLDFRSALLLNALYHIAVSILEVAMGWVADRSSQKKVVVFGSICWVGTFLIYSQTHTLQSFLIAEALAAFGRSSISGALESLASQDIDEPESKNMFGLANMAGSLVSLPGNVLSGYLALAYGYQFNFLLMSIILLPCVYLVLGMEDGDSESGNVEFSWKKVLESIQQPELRLILIYNFVGSIVNAGMFSFWAILLLEDGGLNKDAIGWVAALMFLAMAGGSWAFNRSKQSDTCLLRSGIGLKIIGFGTVVFIGSFPALTVLGISLYEISLGLTKPLTQSLVNKHAPKEIKATVYSVVSMVSTIGGCIGLLAWGVLADFLSPSWVWLVCGALLIATLPLIKLSKK